MTTEDYNKMYNLKQLDWTGKHNLLCDKTLMQGEFLLSSEEISHLIQITKMDRKERKKNVFWIKNDYYVFVRFLGKVPEFKPGHLLVKLEFETE